MAVITGSFNSLVSGTISGVFQNTAGGVLSGVIGTPGPQGIPGPAGPAGQDAMWGDITGIISDQTDLQGELDDKLPLAGGAMDTGATIGLSNGSYAASLSPTHLNFNLNTPTIGDYVIQSNHTYYNYASGYTDYIDDGEGNPTASFERSATVGAGQIDIVNNDIVGSLNRTISLNANGGITLYNTDGNSNTSVYTSSNIVFSEAGITDSELAGWGLGVELSADHTQGTTVEYNGLNVYNGTDTINVNPTGINLTNNDTTKHTNITTSYINVTDDNNGYNVQLADGTITLTNGGTDSVLSINSNTGITFDDNTVQNTAFPGFTGFAPLASPAFTGNPTAPTPALGDNDTSIATTAFVQSAIVAGSAHAETLVSTVRNNTGSTLAAFTVVYISGAVGNKAAVAKAQANSESTSSGTFAVTETAIANNADGNVVSAGVLSGVDTSSFTDGDKLYLSPTVAGGVTTTKPSAPNHLVYVGVVTRSHPSLGTVSVRIQNGYELDELHDVAISSKTNLDLLSYESSTSLWKNKSFSTLGLLTSATAASTYAPLASPTFTGTVTIPSGASISGFAPLASPTFTGTPLSTTAAVDTNTTQIATTAYVVGQGYAKLASPTFSGTPSLPTGTTGITQTAGNNTTALATTAFVTAAVPAFATVANSFAQNNTAPVTALTSLLASATPAVFIPMPVSMSAAQAGTGATSAPSGSSILPMAISLQAPNASTTGYAAKGIIIGLPSLTNAASIDWSKPMAFSCRLYSPTLGTAKTDVKVRGVLGRDGNTFQAPGALAVKGFGWEFNNATGVLSAIAHNGSSLTTTAVTFTPVNSRPVDITSYSDGAGTVSIYVNGTLAGTATGGPTGVASVTNIWAQWEIENTSTSSAANTNVVMYNPKVMTTF